MSKLFVFRGGVILAQRPDDLQKSDDGGQAWHSVSLPPAGPPVFARHGAFGLVATGPGDPRVLFATGVAPLYKSTDGGATWHVALNVSNNAFADGTWYWTESPVVAVSPVTPTRIYAEVPAIQSTALYMSTDSGNTWTLRQTVFCGMLSYPQILILMTHPTNPDRLFRDIDCLKGGDPGFEVRETLDEGQTFTTFWGRAGFPGVTEGFPRALVGGTGAAPNRWYLAVNEGQPGWRLGSTLLLSDDDGATWQDVLAYRCRTAADPGCQTPGNGNVQIVGLAYDPMDPDRLYVARVAGGSGGIAMTTDAGSTWNNLANQDLGMLFDLALAPDRKTLYAATDHGVWRLDLSDVP